MAKMNHSYQILIAAPRMLKSGELDFLSEKHGFKTVSANNVSDAFQIIESNKLDIILVEKDLKGLKIIDLIIKVRSIDPDIPVIIADNSNSGTLAEQIWNCGIDDFLLFPTSQAELNHRITRSLKLKRLAALCEQLKNENRNLRTLSRTDGLTRLTNRRYFNEVLKTEFARVKRYGGSLGCLMVDIDHFKRVNDTWGHLTGDRILKELSEIIRQNVRSIDIVARYGGEEFILLLPETTGESIIFVGEKLRGSVESNDFRDPDDKANPGPDHITISIGAASFPSDSIGDSESLVEQADKALYKAKQTGRNRVVQL